VLPDWVSEVRGAERLIGVWGGYGRLNHSG
jgi:hypothetical protein